MSSIKAEESQIAEANFSDDFIATTVNLGILKVGDLLKLSPQQLMDLPDFTFKMLCEYRQFLAKNGLDTK